MDHSVTTMGCRSIRIWSSLAWLAILGLPSAGAAQVRVAELGFLQGHDGAAFVAADRPMEALYTPSMLYQWNSLGGVNTVSRNAEGEYTVMMPLLGGVGGNVQVTAYGQSAARCKVRSWFGFFTLNVNVDCYLGEEKQDTQFIVSFERVSTDSGDIAYAWAPRTDPSVLPSYPAPPFYALHFTDFARSRGFETPLPSQAGLMQVTAYGDDSENCIVSIFAGVACFNAAGTNVRAPYSVTVHLDRVANAGRLGAYVSFDFASSQGVPSWPQIPFRQFGTPMPIRAERIGTGYYRIFLPGMPSSDAAVPMVSGYDIETSGDKSIHCKPLAWFPMAGETVVDVRCFGLGGSTDGQQQDAQFNLSYLTNQPL